MCNHKRHDFRTQDCWSSMKFGCSLLNANSSQIRIYVWQLFAELISTFVNKRPKSRWDSGNRSSEGLQQATFSKVTSSGWSCQCWLDKVSPSDIRHQRLDLLSRILSIYIIIYIYIYSLVPIDLFALFCRMPSTPAFLRRIRHRQKRDTMRVSFVDVPLQ